MMLIYLTMIITMQVEYIALITDSHIHTTVRIGDFIMDFMTHSGMTHFIMIGILHITVGVIRIMDIITGIHHIIIAGIIHITIIRIITTIIVIDNLIMVVVH